MILLSLIELKLMRIELATKHGVNYNTLESLPTLFD